MHTAQFDGGVVGALHFIRRGTRGVEPLAKQTRIFS